MALRQDNRHRDSACVFIGIRNNRERLGSRFFCRSRKRNGRKRSTRCITSRPRAGDGPEEEHPVRYIAAAGREWARRGAPGALHRGRGPGIGPKRSTRCATSRPRAGNGPEEEHPVRYIAAAGRGWARRGAPGALHRGRGPGMGPKRSTRCATSRPRAGDGPEEEHPVRYIAAAGREWARRGAPGALHRGRGPGMGPKRSTRCATSRPRAGNGPPIAAKSQSK